MMFATRLVPAVFTILGTLSTALAAPPDAAGPALAVTLKASDIDATACKAWVDGTEAEGDFKNAILATLGVAGGSPWSAGQPDTVERAKQIRYLVVLKKPVKFGALLFQQHGSLRYLAPGAALPPDPSRADEWVDVTFPPNQSGWRLATTAGESRAFLCTVENTGGDWSRFAFLRLMKQRLHNIVPEGIANGEAEYVAYSAFGPPTYFKAANIVAGSGGWRSHGPEAAGRVPRAPVTDIDPTWFVVSWDEPREVTGLVMASNFTAFKVYAYQGPAGINPAVAGPQDWSRIQQEPRAEGSLRWLSFPPVSTRGLKFVAESTAGAARWGSIDGLQVFTDLGDGPVPPPVAAVTEPPLAIEFTLPEPRIVSLAIDAGDGRRVRTFPARLKLEAGAHRVGWDLKDESGAVVLPGTYTWKAITHPGLRLKYRLTPYPNVTTVTTENSPWFNGESGSGGWLADHTPPRTVCPVGGGRVFIGAPGAESGVTLLECDLEGRKSWGHGGLGGLSFLATDGTHLYGMPAGAATDSVWRFSLPEKKLDVPLSLAATPTRRRGTVGMAVRDGMLYVAVNAPAESGFGNAFAAADVDLDNCEPKYPKPLSAAMVTPDRRGEFLGLLRLTGMPPGSKGLTHLETAKQPAARQHIVVALKRESPLGSLVFPLPETQDLRLVISVLKPGAAYPPNPNTEGDWTRIYAGTGKGWTVVTAPEKTVTRAIRLSFDKGLDELDETLLGDEGEPSLDGGLGLDDPGDDAGGTQAAKAPWFAQLEGLKILERRFGNLFPACKLSVSSGTVTPEGEWDAQRDKPLTPADPGIYMMEWEKPQPIRGLAIKEIDGRFTDIDAWTGDGFPDMRAEQGWEKLATYEQPLRDYAQPSPNNSEARYLDGYVDFGRDVTTRAIRMRVRQQWMWREQGGGKGVRSDRGGTTLDPTRCRIDGVAVLTAVGVDAPRDTLATQRIEVYDLGTKKLVKEVPFPWGANTAGDLAFAPDGTLHGISDGKVVKVDVEGGRHAPLPLDVRRPTAITFGSAGELFVFDAAEDQRVIRVFDTAGRPLRTIGTPGGRIVGPYDPERFASSTGVAIDLAVDEQDQLWVAECDYDPKRVSIWGVDGTFKKDLLGNTGYGGGGCLDPHDPSRLFYSTGGVSGLEFALDWKTGTTALKNVLWMGATPAGERPIRVEDRLYLVTQPKFTGQAVGIVYLHEQDRLRCVAAMGDAGQFPPLRTSAIFDKLGRQAVGTVDFVWSDRSGDGSPQPDEVEFFPRDRRSASPGRFDETLGVDSPGFRYEVTEILASGVPVYERREKTFESRVVRMDDGRFFVVGEERMAALDADGNVVWAHPTEGWGVQAIGRAKTPWYPGQTVAQLDVVGHETAPAGDLGEFFVTNTNCGTWHIWTADGLLAGRIFQDLLGPGAKPWSMREHDRGLDLSDITVGQEHFSGYFCKSRSDGRFYAVAGHNHISVVEVEGFEQFQRLGGTITVGKEDIAEALAWDRGVQSRQLYEAARVIECRRRKAPVSVDGDPAEWDFKSGSLEGRDVSLAMAYDDTSLYVCYTASRAGPLVNTGNDWRRLFKTGAAVDLQIGLDPQADLERREPAVGDTRLLMTLMGKEPTAVIYQPNAPGSRPDEAWETQTQVARSAFDRVATLPEVRLAARSAEQSYCVEAVIPLQALGLTIVPDVPYKFDWGILVSGPDGSEVMERAYWANSQTRMLSDEPIESQLHPDLWGILRFTADSGPQGKPSLDLDGRLETDDLDIDLDE